MLLFRIKLPIVGSSCPASLCTASIIHYTITDTHPFPSRTAAGWFESGRAERFNLAECECECEEDPETERSGISTVVCQTDYLSEKKMIEYFMLPLPASIIHSVGTELGRRPVIQAWIAAAALGPRVLLSG